MTIRMKRRETRLAWLWHVLGKDSFGFRWKGGYDTGILTPALPSLGKRPWVEFVAVDSAASESGLKMQDVIVMINGHDTQLMSNAQCHKLVSKAKSLNLVLYRPVV